MYLRQKTRFNKLSETIEDCFACIAVVLNYYFHRFNDRKIAFNSVFSE